MARIYRSSAVAANAVVSDQFEEDRLSLADRFAQSTGPVTFAATQSATGLTMSLETNKTIIATGLQPRVDATAPKFPDESLVEDAIMSGEILALRLNNATGGVITLFYAYEIP